MIAIKPPKSKTCRSCGTKFTPHRTLMAARVCSPLCGLELARNNRLKAERLEQAKERKETKAKLDKLKSRSEWAREAQTAFNAWVRARDAGNACISCGRHHQGQNHAGHYLSVGARPELRYEPLNVWLQCSPCNLHLSGNAVLFRKSLLEKIGAEKVEWLEGPHPTRHYSIDELKAIKTTYAAKARAIKGASQ